MKKSIFIILSLCLLGISSIFTGCKQLRNFPSYIFNLSSAPSDSNGMQVYLDAYCQDGTRSANQTMVGIIENNKLSFTHELSPSTAYVYFLLVKEGYGRVYYYGSMDLNSATTTYNFTGYWFYNYAQIEMTNHTSFSMVAITEDYFKEPALPISNTYSYTYNDYYSDLFHTYKINTKENGCIKISSSQNDYTEMYITKNVSQLTGKQPNEIEYLSGNTGIKIYETDGSPLYILIRPEHYFNSEETSKLIYTIEDMNDKLPNTSIINSVSKFDDNGFYFIKENESTNKPSNLLQYFEYSSKKLSTIKTYPSPIAKVEFSNNTAYVAYDKTIAKLDLSSNTSTDIYTGEYKINDILLIENDAKLFVADVEGKWKLFNLPDFDTPILSSNSSTNLDRSSAPYKLIYIPETRRLVWDEFGINTGVFNSDFTEYLPKRDICLSNRNNGRIFQIGNTENIITGYGHFLDLANYKKEPSKNLSLSFDTALNACLFYDSFWFTGNSYSEIEKRSLEVPYTVIASTKLSDESIIAMTKDSTGNLIVITHGPRLSNNLREIIVHKYNTELENVSSKSINLSVASKKLSDNDLEIEQ